LTAYREGRKFSSFILEFSFYGDGGERKPHFMIITKEGGNEIKKMHSGELRFVIYRREVRERDTLSSRHQQGYIPLCSQGSFTHRELPPAIRLFVAAQQQKKQRGTTSKLDKESLASSPPSPPFQICKPTTVL